MDVDRSMVVLLETTSSPRLSALRLAWHLWFRSKPMRVELGKLRSLSPDTESGGRQALDPALGPSPGKVTRVTRTLGKDIWTETHSPGSQFLQRTLGMADSPRAREVPLHPLTGQAVSENPQGPLSPGTSQEVG